MSISLSVAQLAGLKEGFDDLLTFFGKECKLIYQPKLVDCPECTGLGVNTYSESHWTHGGPLRIDQQGICTMCGGTKKKTQETSENITLSIGWNIPIDKEHIPTTNVSYSIIQTRGLIKDLPKVQRCIELQVQLPIYNYVVGRYKLRGEGVDVFGIVQNRYFVCSWERIS